MKSIKITPGNDPLSGNDPPPPQKKKKKKKENSEHPEKPIGDPL